MLSYSRGPEVELLQRTTSEQLDYVAGHWPNETAIVSVHQNRRLTWRELRDAAASVAGGLQELDLFCGDRVGVWATNCLEWLVLYYACARSGIIFVSLNPACRVHELSFILNRSQIKALFLYEKDERVRYVDVLCQARVESKNQMQHAICFDTHAWTRLQSAQAIPATGCDLDDVMNIQYTSGTTGKPKGVLLSHRNLVNNGYLIARNLGYTVEDRICVPVPLSHCFGSVIGAMASVASGAAMILPNWYFDAGATLSAVQAEGVTSLYGVPTMFISELSHGAFSQFDVSSLRTGMMAGAPCPMELMKRVVAELHCPELTIGYGMTETSPVITMSNIDDDLDHRVCTVGKAMPCTEIKVVSLANGDTVPTGIQGEICARGYMVMKGYDGEPEATAQVVDDEGWLRTGDLGTMRDDGYLQITGRAKDMIIRGGENVYPREVEEFLYTHPKVAEVHVTGLPDKRLGEIVIAWVRLKADHMATVVEIQEFCQGRIAHFKIPQHIRFVDSFPTTLSGKIQKFRIREIELQDRATAKA
jgi:fatty-acyl-CoA synthase